MGLVTIDGQKVAYLMDSEGVEGAVFDPGLLADGALWTGPAVFAQGMSRVVGMLAANIAGTLTVRQSQDGTNWDVDFRGYLLPSHVAGLYTFSFDSPVVSRFVQARFQNVAGLGAQTVFRCIVYVRPVE